MTKSELLDLIATHLNGLTEIAAADRIEGEDIVGIDVGDDNVYFLTRGSMSQRTEQTAYAPALTRSSGLRWARRKARDHAKTSAPTQLHIADAAGRLICDGGPSVSKSVDEPTLASDVHSICLHVYRRDHVK